ncbi:DUF1343 domain-containing protein [Dysgonomonas sp. Marseille-P4677]|uniref:exo-beta-N-acetylmuramidase NamZ family protein n=1 Tax=Dysgonomonas sp. Marseille-P4677 TaxID=2364790 RepID=UPI0019145523|nr:DUF1343 domain-containing protein [Dysgonomonas sp. Marseille-P4677]MBK5719245.1 DUF1343 domain-containing protein [Dysgonomonas sp. Marseille-P4677]
MKKLCLSLFIFLICSSNIIVFAQNLTLGADRLDQLLSFTQNKKVALVINQTSILSDGTHILDALLSRNTHIVKIFAPEHGFRGDADAGEKIVDGKDSRTGIPLISLYGKNYKPSTEQLNDVDIIIFDIQDVGARFYTYISTMHYVLEACAENNKQCIVLDRPNPNDQIDGPVLDLKYKSFVGMHPIPILHGLTIGELAEMINGEGWLKNKTKCNLKVIPMIGWKHGQSYSLPIKPSPNLPNDQSIYLYPSLCFFEATNVSVGRGTDFPFQVIGAPNKKYGVFNFTPQSNEGNKSPLNLNKTCYGKDLRDYKSLSRGIDLSFLIDFYHKSGQGAAFFTNPEFMDLLAGTNSLRLQILKGGSKEMIYKNWENDLNTYKTMRKKYLLYPEN